MPLFEIAADGLNALPETTFAEVNVRERQDLQRVLRAQIEVLDPGLFVLTEEFGDWEDSNRRIDLLAMETWGRCQGCKGSAEREVGRERLTKVPVVGEGHARANERCAWP